MSEVTEGELVMWSVDPGPMAGVLERQLWRMATAARSYLNRMRAAELAHGVMAGERDTVTVENERAAKAIGLALTVLSGVVELDVDEDTIVDAANKAAAEHRQMRTDHFEALTRLTAVVLARDGARKQRDELRAELAEARRERDEALAKVADLESMRAGVAYFACWPDGMLEALGATDVSGVADVMERVMALVGAERERDRLLRSEADVCAILGAAPDELLSDAARRVHNEAGRYRSWVNECALSIGESKHSNVPDRVAAIVRQQPAAGVDRLRTLASIVGLSELATWDDLAAFLRGRAEAEPPQVFRPFITVTMCPDRKGEPYASLDVPPIRDPAFLALSGHQLSRLGLVVCDG